MFDPNAPQVNQDQEAIKEQTTQGSAALNAAVDQANDALGKPTQDSEEGSTEG